MNRKIKLHNADFIKRQAKSIKKSDNISYLKALDKAANNAGFECWKHFLKENKRDNSTSIKSQGSFSTIDVNVLKSEKGMHPYRKLLVEAINELVNRGLVSLDGSKEGIGSENEKGYIITEIFGFTSAVLWDNIGFQELRVSVWWKYNHGKHPQANLSGSFQENFKTSSPLAKRHHYKEFVGTVVSGWLERNSGKYLQGIKNKAIFDTYSRSGERQVLENIPSPIPNGFLSEGKFHF